MKRKVRIPIDGRWKLVGAFLGGLLTGLGVLAFNPGDVPQNLAYAAIPLLGLGAYCLGKNRGGPAAKRGNYFENLGEEGLEGANGSAPSNGKGTSLPYSNLRVIRLVAHELKTPLTSVRTYADMLRMYKNQPWAIQEEFLSIIVHEAIRMEKIINCFLELSRLEAGQLEYDDCGVDLKKTVLDRLRELNTARFGREVELDVVLREDLPKLTGDGKRISQAISFLLDAAVQRARPEGKVHLRLDMDGKTLSTQSYPCVELLIKGGPQGLSKKQRGNGKQKSVGADADGQTNGNLEILLASSIISHHGGQIRLEEQNGRGWQALVHLPVSGDSSMGKH